jgi:hypothetical protein
LGSHVEDSADIRYRRVRRGELHSFWET